jgi:hypothetical protein
VILPNGTVYNGTTIVTYQKGSRSETRAVVWEPQPDNHPLMLDYEEMPSSGGAKNLDLKEAAYVYNETDDNNYNSEETEVVFINFSEYHSLWESHTTYSQQTREDISQYFNETWEGLENGSITVGDVAATAPSALARNAGLRYDDTNQTNYIKQQLAATGINGTVNATHTVETKIEIVKTYDNGTRSVTNRSVTVEGSLFYTGNDIDTFETGKTYNPEKTEGSDMMVVDSMDGYDYSSPYLFLRYNYTIVETINPETGEQIDNVSVIDRTYGIQDPGSLPDDLNKTEQAQQRILDVEVPAVGGGGGGGDSDSGSGIPLLAGIAAALGVSTGLAALLVLAGVLLALRVTT